MGKGFKKGAGGANPLNFKIVGGTTKPSNPRLNTIWVNTGTEITSWIFSATEPSTPEPGMVWLQIGTIGRAGFNALKKNSILLQPSLAKQYVTDKWESKPAMTFLKQSEESEGSWVEWAWYMFKEDAGFAEGFTGFHAGWVSGEITYTDGRIIIPLYKEEGYSGECFVSNEKIDLTNYTMAYLSGLTVSHYGAGGYATTISYGFGADESQFEASEYIDTSSGSNGEYITDGILAIDVSELRGEHYLMGKFNCSDDDITYFTTKIKNIYFI